MTHQNLRLLLCWKLFRATLRYILKKTYLLVLKKHNYVTLQQVSCGFYNHTPAVSLWIRLQTSYKKSDALSSSIQLSNHGTPTNCIKYLLIGLVIWQIVTVFTELVFWLERNVKQNQHMSMKCPDSFSFYLQH